MGTLRVETNPHRCYFRNVAVTDSFILVGSPKRIFRCVHKPHMKHVGNWAAVLVNECLIAIEFSCALKCFDCKLLCFDIVAPRNLPSNLVPSTWCLYSNCVWWFIQEWHSATWISWVDQPISWEVSSATSLLLMSSEILLHWKDSWLVFGRRCVVEDFSPGDYAIMHREIATSFIKPGWSNANDVAMCIWEKTNAMLPLA